MTKPACVILAGGQARRMGGGDKGLITLGNRVLLDYVIERIAPQTSAIVLNANGDAARFDRFGLPVISDSIEGLVGPLAGVLAGMDWAHKQGANYVVSVAADTPFFPTTLVPSLLEACQSKAKPIALAASIDPERGMVRQPVFGLWPVDLREDLRQSLKEGIRKIVLWADKHGAASALFDHEVDPFFNINTPEDVAKAKLLIESNKV